MPRVCSRWQMAVAATRFSNEESVSYLATFLKFVEFSTVPFLDTLKLFFDSSAAPVLGRVEVLIGNASSGDWIILRRQGGDSVVPREALSLSSGSLPLVDRCRPLAKGHPMLYFSDQVPMSDKKRSHHSHKHRHKPLQMQFWGSWRAHFNGRAPREIFVDLPEEEQDGEHCGLLVKSMYGTQHVSVAARRPLASA